MRLNVVSFIPGAPTARHATFAPTVFVLDDASLVQPHKDVMARPTRNTTNTDGTARVPPVHEEAPAVGDMDSSALISWGSLFAGDQCPILSSERTHHSVDLVGRWKFVAGHRGLGIVTPISVF